MEKMENENRNLPGENAVVTNKIKTARKKGATRGAVITGIIFLFVLLVSGLIVHKHFRQEIARQETLREFQKDTYTKVVTDRDSVINAWLSTFDEIEKDMDTIFEELMRYEITSAGVKKVHKIWWDRFFQIGNLFDPRQFRVCYYLRFLSIDPQRGDTHVARI